MTAKEFIVNDLVAEKNSLIETIRKNSLTDEERAVVNGKIDALESRIAAANALEEDKSADEAIQSLNAKYDAIKEKMMEKGLKLPVVENGYLDSKNAVKDFAQSMRNAKTKNVRFSDEWGSVLAKNGISFGLGEEAYLPTPVKGYIEDAWREYGDVLNEFFNTGAKSFYVRYTEQTQDSTDVRAKGYNPKTRKNKTEQNVELSAFLIQSEYVYKLIPVSNKTIWEDDTLLIQWVLNELVKQWNYEVLRAILVGDGRTGAEAINSIQSITNAVSANFATTINYDSTKELVEQIVEAMIEPIYNGENDVLLFCNKSVFSALRKYIPAAGATPTYRSADEVAAMLGVKRIVTVPYMANPADATSSDVVAIAVHAKKYAITGSLTPDFYSWEDPLNNETYYRVEIPVGGALAGLNSAVVMNGATE